MKKLTSIIILLLSIFSFGCSKNGCTYNGKPLKVGPEGGCYYVTDKGNKEYVDRSACNCN